MRIETSLSVLMMILVCVDVSGQDVDLSTKYKADLNFSSDSTPYDWECRDSDVWELADYIFRYEDLEIEMGACSVVFGQHDSNVVWAAVIAREPGEIAEATDGKGEQISSVWLRFHPSLVGDLFPPESVNGNGEAKLIDEAKRIAAHKMRASWHNGGRPMIPMKSSIVLDVETVEGNRRFYLIDTDKKTVQYVDAFRNRPLSKPTKLTGDQALEVFDNVWGTFDKEYAMFVVKGDVDWKQVRDEFRPMAEKATSNVALANTLSKMLSNLEDLHIYVMVDGSFVPGYSRHRPLNANRKALSSVIGSVTDTGHQLSWARTDDDIGYITIDGLQDAQLPKTFIDVLTSMDDTKGLIVDLRYNGGGSEPLAMQIAAHFLDEKRVYAKQQYRDGPDHDDLGPKYERSLSPETDLYYVGPVVCLLGQRTMSSAEGFALMMEACPNVTTMGDRTAGSSGNPKRIDAGAGIVVNLPRWNPLDAEGNPIDAVGIKPEVEVETSDESFQGDNDPVLDAALEHLRDKPTRKDAVLIKR